MKTSHGGITACVLALCCLANAGAATICVPNKQTGRLEPRDPGKGSAQDCARAAQGGQQAGPLPPGDNPPASNETLTVPVPVSSVTASGQTSASKAMAVPGKSTATVSDAVVPQRAPHTWYLKPEHRSIREVIEDWAAETGAKGEGYDVIWETRDFPLTIKQRKAISTGEIWEALRIIGESFRDSDAAFQIQPTAFKQLVVIPMNKTEQQQGRQQ